MKIPLISTAIWKTGKLNIGLFLLILLLAALEPKASEFLRYDRYAINAGEWWRLLTGHIVHLGWAHAFLNLSGLALITVIFQQEMSFKNDSIALAVCMGGTAFGIYIFSPDMIWYMGLSGALHGYLIYYLIKGYKVSPLISFIALTTIISKVLWEQSPWGDTSQTEQLIGGTVAIDSHLFGSISGIVIGLIALKFFKQPPATASSSERISQ